MTKRKVRPKRAKKYDYGYLEFELENGKKIRRKIRLPVPRYNYGIYKVRGSYVVLSGWTRPNPKKYNYDPDYLVTDYYDLPKDTKVVRLIVGKRVVSKWER